MREYETIVITKSDANEAYLSGLVKKIDKAISTKPGEIIKKNDWGLKRLAYEIDKQKKGHFLYWSYRQNPEITKEVDRHLKFDENILRYMTLVTSDGDLKKEDKAKEIKPKKVSEE